MKPYAILFFEHDKSSDYICERTFDQMPDKDVIKQMADEKNANYVQLWKINHFGIYNSCYMMEEINYDNN